MAQRPQGESVPLWARLTVALGILLLWGSSVVWDMANKSYETPLPVHGLAGVGVSFVFGREFGRVVREKINGS